MSFKNLSSPKTNANPPKKEEINKPQYVVDDMTVNGERVNKCNLGEPEQKFGDVKERMPMKLNK